MCEFLNRRFNYSVNDCETGIPNRGNRPYRHRKGYRKIPFCYNPNGRLPSWKVNIYRLLPGKETVCSTASSILITFSDISLWAVQS